MKTPWLELLRSDSKSETVEKSIVDVEPINVIENASLATAQLGDVIDGDIVYKIDSTHVWLVAPATKRSTMQWGLDGTNTALPNISRGTDPNSGEYNTSLLVTNHGSNAVADYHCQTLAGGPYFLPNKEELLEIYNLRSTIDTFDTSGGVYTLGYFVSDNKNVWSSTELNSNFAWGLYFRNGGLVITNKSYTLAFVVPVRKIKI